MSLGPAFRWISCFLAAAMLAACSGPSRPRPDWSASPKGEADIAAECQRQQADLDKALETLASHPHKGGMDVLALSAGGQSGAFGAGIMQGWTEQGDRPEFSLITGVSTGALIAVFAFIGPEGDAALRELYTTHSTSDVYTRRWWVELPFNDSYARSSPLRSMITRHLTEDVVCRIADEQAKGRVLLIATADLDLNHLRIWNMSALAADESMSLSERTARFREILAASLSIPTLVPPVFLDQHMHADGGLFLQVFLADRDREEEFHRVLCADGPPRIWTIINRRLAAPPRVIDDHIIDVTKRSLQILVDSGLIKDIDEIRHFATDCGGRFSLAILPTDPSRPDPADMFDREYMRSLHDLGVGMAHSGQAWTGPPVPKSTPAARASSGEPRSGP